MDGLGGVDAEDAGLFGGPAPECQLDGVAVHDVGDGGPPPLLAGAGDVGQLGSHGVGAGGEHQCCDAEQ
jgi:hypothetical protein